ncbi:MAG TPA: aminotransferase class V-fold PLP-dependent enzyme [Gemmatimonadaceae bacterium]|nr:aminotransferase class V-fold PLP-dependent enzyme [Gemmatimonadaceae bacterium]
MTIEFGAARAREYPWMTESQIVYLDHASTGACPKSTGDAVQSYVQLRHMPHTLKGEHFFAVLQKSRELAAQLVGASAAEIALTTNTSHGLNLAAFALPIDAGDEILTVDREFPANVFPWIKRAERSGATIVRLPCVDDVPDEASLMEAIATRSRVKVVTVSWVSFCSGARLDITKIGQACRERGIFFVVDAIQGLGALPLDLSVTPVDILSCGAQKWLQSPWGSAFTYVRRELITQLEPPTVGWMSTRGSDDLFDMLSYDPVWFDDARRFEVITLPFPDFAGMNASLELFRELGVEHVAEHIATLGDRLVDFCDAHPQVHLVTPRDRARRAGVFAVQPPELDTVSARLRAAQVIHSVRERCVRLAPHWYTTAEQWDRALQLLV